jgi:uncharacterized protein (TIGR00730 family)
MIRSVCVFCGARQGRDPAFAAAAGAFGSALSARGLRLVYGGGRIGLMGLVADAVLASKGQVTGVLPRFLARHEILHAGVQEHIEVDDLFERKRVMLARADAFVALPGGIGTLDELLEVIAWRQLGQLDCPIGMLNVNAFFEPWLVALRASAAAGFISATDIDALAVHASPDGLLDMLLGAEAPT